MLAGRGEARRPRHLGLAVHDQLAGRAEALRRRRRGLAVLRSNAVRGECLALQMHRRWQRSPDGIMGLAHQDLARDVIAHVARRVKCRSGLRLPHRSFLRGPCGRRVRGRQQLLAQQWLLLLGAKWQCPAGLQALS